MIIRSKRIYTEDLVVDGYLVFDQGKIQAIKPYTENLEADLDVKDKRIIPGIFDTHNHGTYGYMLEDLRVDAKAHIQGYLKALAAQGVTGVFPTCASFSNFPSCSPAMIKTIAEVAKEDSEGATILGIHSEGPWLNRTGEKGGKVVVPKADLQIAKQMVEPAVTGNISQ